MPKQAIFIRRLHRGRKIKHPLYDFYRDCYRFFKPGGHRWRYKGQNGFFRAALSTVYRVKNIRIQNALKNIEELSKKSSVIVCDSKAFLDNSHRRVMPLDFLSKTDTALKALLVANARPDIIPSDDILDSFDIIFKREPFTDRERYDISTRNRDKIRPTMLGCPLIEVTPRNVQELDPSGLGFTSPPESFKHDVFFSGINTAIVREKFVKKLSEEPFNFCGGLQFRKREPAIDPVHAFPRLNKKKYIDITRRSRINLALEGEGPFTYRHLEMWFLCSFMISTPNIRHLQLPIETAENRDYVCYENYDDLVAKIEYFRKNREKRNRIALAGRKMFEREFSYTRHGKYIRNCIEKSE